MVICFYDSGAGRIVNGQLVNGSTQPTAARNRFTRRDVTGVGHYTDP